MDTATLIRVAHASGGIVYIMALLLLIALTVIFERSWYLRRLIRKGDTITRTVAALTHLDIKTVRDLSERYKRFPLGAVLVVPLHYPEVTDPVRLSELLEEAIMWQVPKIDRSLWMLDTIVTLAPLLGLLGTIIGMFNAFQVLGSSSGGAPTQITGGVAEALVATACGLFIAIIGLVFFNSLQNLVRRVVHQMETLKVMLVNRVDAPRAVEPASPPKIRAMAGAREG